MTQLFALEMFYCFQNSLSVKRLIQLHNVSEMMMFMF